MARNANRVYLSKSILEMKFMKRTKDKVEKQTYQKEGEDYFSSQQQLPKKTGRYITEASYIFCEDLIEGRLSFQGENPELERLLELEQMEKNPKVENDMDTDVSDAQMAARWRATTKINVRSLDNKKEEVNEDEQEPKRKKPKFLKPVDD
ncbi:M-phase phosphoprotein 6 [Nasonia vitripennis]|uniref:M-phase phosphoprotein 6 n=1 Tax=Nasonia vitripennis TaxID=7425 RepID=A0A7M7G6B6_NASVI|nr:M-phase phosphoprotein 6 [Nasonia vitripennis]